MTDETFLAIFLYTMSKRFSMMLLQLFSIFSVQKYCFSKDSIWKKYQEKWNQQHEASQFFTLERKKEKEKAPKGVT